MNFKKRKVASQLKNSKKQDLSTTSDTSLNGVATETASGVAETATVTVEEIKLLQTVRKRQQGLEAWKLIIQKQEPDINSDSNKLDDDKKQEIIENEKNSTLMSLDAFTQQTNTLDANKNMLKYIEEEMFKRKKESIEQTSTEHGSAEKSTAVSSELDVINAIEAKYVNTHYITNAGKKAETEGNIAISTAMLTSINEVDLGIRSRLKNIEDTELAKKKINSRENKKIKESENSEIQNVRYTIYTDSSSNRKQRSDNIVVEKFKKKYRY
ncbi:hypothetical protein BB561_001526 [Smittium simulii]|uniref:Uncharacterized protein n=1 Tax=Smittium simulii TaxID=133385 RepID=A0A2T9YU41_9FUNG|nr:hypothetical protein BB561_001526 [Smittium simulii]